MTVEPGVAKKEQTVRSLDVQSPSRTDITSQQDRRMTGILGEATNRRAEHSGIAFSTAPLPARRRS